MKVFKHLWMSSASRGRCFPSHALTAIEDAIEESEKRHRAEIRFAIETALELSTLLRVATPRDRALEVFAELCVADTAERNGVLIYVLLAERKVEIVADRGFEGRVSEDEWRAICATIEAAFQDERWRSGALIGITAVTALLVREFPANGPNPDEQINRPSLL